MRISSMDLFFRREAAGGAGPAVGGAWASLDAGFAVSVVAAAVVNVGKLEVVEVAVAAPRPPNMFNAEEVAVVAAAVVVAAGMPPETASADDFCPMLPNKLDAAAVVAGVAEAEVCPKLPNKPDVGAELIGTLVEPPKGEAGGALVVAVEFEANSDGALVLVMAELPPNSPDPLVAAVVGLAPKREAALVVVVEERPPNSDEVVVAAVKGLEVAG